MADSATTAVPTLQVSTAVTDTDHGQIVVLAAWLCFTAGVLLSAVRVYIRWPLNALAGKDDYAYAISFLLAIVQTAVTVNAVKNGFGRTESELDGRQAIDAAKALYASDILFLLSLWSSKISVSFLFTRLAKETSKSRIGWILTAFISAIGVISILSVSIRPNIAQPYLYRSGNVQPILARWIATGVMSICIDLLITAMSVNLVWGLQMGSKSKSLVVTAFTLRLFVTPVTIIRLVSLSAVRPDDFSFTYTLPEAMTQLEMYCSLIATTLPCLRLFLTAWNTSFMDIRLEEIDNDAYREHVTTMSGSGSKGSATRSGGFSKNRASSAPRATWAPSSGRSKAFVETGTHGRDADAASENSESAIVVKRTIDVSDGRQR
ncbi:hypothetical protein WHR41_01444 [Cladosporium halotolerans]|uniref:Rhodopsin domain-containing protein n=1 Tax=Cladosporium halotolerans TaxID=1052096 RepID=A0AB34L1I6_9PEZI